jgi:hypothetical protein
VDGSNHLLAQANLAATSDVEARALPAGALRPGRRARPEHLRTDPFSLRLTREERQVVEAAAARSGIRVPATWARAALVEAARRIALEAAPPAAPPGADRTPGR